MSATIEQAIQLYNEGKYLEAMDMGKELITEPDMKKDVWLLCAKCIMVNVPAPTSENELNEVADSLIRSINETKSIEEAFEVWMGFLPAFSLWKKKMAIRALAEFEANPCKETFDKYTRLFIALFTASMSVTLPAKNKSIMPQLAAEAGMTLQEAVAKYENGKEFDDAYSEAVQDQLEYETVSRVMTKAIQDFELHKVVSRENFKSVQMPIGTTVVYATCLYNPMREQERKGIPESVRVQRLKDYATWKRFLLEARFIVDGAPAAMYTPDDDKDLQDLQKIYNKIKALDPSFEIPPLPEIMKNTPAKSSGGCYVATAVYGSYDCPQVWTLRRFRDNTLAETWYGRAFIRTYYAISPTLVKWFGKTNWFKKLWRGRLDRMVEKLQSNGVASTPYEDKPW